MIEVMALLYEFDLLKLWFPNVQNSSYKVEHNDQRGLQHIF